MNWLFVERQMIVNEAQVFCSPMERFPGMVLSLSDSETMPCHTSTMALYQEM